jgi:cysteine desulfurase / selenocysteine lyase
VSAAGQAQARAAEGMERLRADFPALAQEVHGHPLVYLDSAATALKPRSVIDATVQAYARDCANVHRGVHALSERATAAYEGAREKVRRFLHAREAREVVFVRGTTEAINLVAQGLGQGHVREGDEVLVTELEHHSNIVPWQMLCGRTGARLVVAPVDEAGALDLAALEARLSPRTRIVALTHVSNALGTVTPVAEVVRLAHAQGVPVLVDGAQAVPHLPVDVQALGCDFYAFSGHKLFGPTGIGVLYGRREWLERLPPSQGGGDMILSVTFERTVYNRLPYRLEAGTPDIAGAIGLGAAVDYVEAVGPERLAAHDAALLGDALERLRDVPGVRLLGAPPARTAVLPFTLEGVHAHDVGTVLDARGVAVRTGHHCAQPLLARLGVGASVRASLALYNTRADVDALVEGLHHVRGVLA